MKYNRQKRRTEKLNQVIMKIHSRFSKKKRNNDNNKCNCSKSVNIKSRISDSLE